MKNWFNWWNKKIFEEEQKTKKIKIKSITHEGELIDYEEKYLETNFEEIENYYYDFLKIKWKKQEIIIYN